MTTKHTPGPWVASCDDDSTEEANAILADGIIIARVEDAPGIRQRFNGGKIERPGSNAGADSLDEVDANARLIAAAPDLLAFVESLLTLNLPEHITKRAAELVAKTKGAA